MADILHTLTGEVIISGLSARGAVRTALRTGVSLERADLSGLDLHGLDFRGADMRYARFISASLRDVNFMGADFKGVNARGADLTGVITGRVGNPIAHIKRAVKRRFKRFGLLNIKLANRRVRREWKVLRWARASRANRTPIDLRWANLTGTNFTGADMRGADLTRADMRGADLTGADMRDVDTKHTRGWKKS